MRTDHENNFLLRAINSVNRKLVIVTPDFNILAMNDFSENIKGNSSYIGKKCHQFFLGRSKPCEYCPVCDVIRTKSSAARYIPNEVSDLHTGSCIYACPLKLSGDIDAIMILDFDISSMKEIENRLKRSNALFKNLILSSVDGVIAADTKGKILIFNDSAAEVGGYDVDYVLNNMNIRDVYPNDGARKVMKKLRSEEYGGKGKLKSYKVDVLGKDGEHIPISLNAAIVYEDGKEVANIGFFHDLREEIKLKEELDRAQLQLLQSEKMASLGKLAAGVAHQLNNPLGGITLFTQLLLEEYELPKGAKADLQRILEDARRCSETVKDLLEFARQKKQKKEPLNINNTLKRTLFLLENQPLFYDIDINLQLSEEVPLVFADSQQINHMFMNIILNAVDAMGERGTLSIKTYSADMENKVCIDITDSGPGIPENILPHIFEPFFTTKDEGRGTGLGLSLVYGIVESHGGSIAAISENGDGTTFLIELQAGLTQAE